MPRSFRLRGFQRYWLLQIVGWSSMVFVETVNYTFFIVGQFEWRLVGSMTQFALYGLLVTHFYKHFFIKSHVFDRSYTAIWLSALSSTFFISLIKYVLLYAPALFSEPQYFLTQRALIDFLGQMMNIMRYVVVWIIIYYLYKILNKNKQILEEKLLAENLAKTSELELLKSQLNPHFLFNALNSIKALVLIDAEKAREAIIKLSELLRFTLNYERKPLIALIEEINEVEKYLALEKIRFGERFTYSVELEPATLNQKVPPTMILTLVENAIKHGITHLPDGGSVRIVTSIQSGRLRITIYNTGHLGELNIRGIGLKNVKRRLKSLFGNQATFSLGYASQNQVCASVEYPINEKEYAA